MVNAKASVREKRARTRHMPEIPELMAKNGDIHWNQVEAAIGKLGGRKRWDMLLDGKLIITERQGEKPGILKMVKNGIRVDSVPAVKIATLFKEGFPYRDRDIDSWMTKQAPIVDSGLSICYELIEEGPTFLDMARSVLEVGSEVEQEQIAKLLIERGKTFSPKQVEDLKKRFVDGETEIGFNTNGYANLFFVHDEKSVFVLNVNQNSDDWNVKVNKLGNSNRWNRENRLFSRNSLFLPHLYEAREFCFSR